MFFSQKLRCLKQQRKKPLNLHYTLYLGLQNYSRQSHSEDLLQSLRANRLSEPVSSLCFPSSQIVLEAFGVDSGHAV